RLEPPDRGGTKLRAKPLGVRQAGHGRVVGAGRRERPGGPLVPFPLPVGQDGRRTALFSRLRRRDRACGPLLALVPLFYPANPSATGAEHEGVSRTRETCQTG